jgi:hypothetical protein
MGVGVGGWGVWGVVRQGSARFLAVCRSIHFSASRFNKSEPLNVTHASYSGSALQEGEGEGVSVQ